MHFLFKYQLVLFTTLFFINYSKASQVEPLKILFIGNSYTHMNKMPEIFAKIAKSKGENVLVEMCAKSNYNFQLHSKSSDTYQAIKKHKWDYVILQGFSRELSFNENYIDSASVPFFSQILDSIYFNNPCTNVVLYMTWGYKEGFKQRHEINSYGKMTDKIMRGYFYLSEKYDISIAPVGIVWRDVYTLGEINLYQIDNQHPNDYGSYLSACTFYASIFKKSPFGGYFGKINDIPTAQLIQRLSFNCVNNYLEKFNLDNNHIKIKLNKTQVRNNYKVDFEAVYSSGTSITWDFGDGVRSNSTKVSHSYKKLGSYNIKIEIKDSCDLKIFNKKILLSKDLFLKLINEE